MSGHVFRAAWPIVDDHLTRFELVAQAIAELPVLARRQGVRLVGAPVFSFGARGGPLLKVEVPAEVAVPPLAARQRAHDLANVRLLLATGMTPAAIHAHSVLPSAYLEDLLAEAAQLMPRRELA
jgi:hypothetical protein